MTATTMVVRDREPEAEAAIWPDGAAFIDGDYVPIAQAKIPILDWGFLRSDCTYDVVHVWGGRFFRLDHHLDRFARNIEALRLQLPLYAFVIPFLWIATEEQRARGLHVHVSLIPRIPPQSVNPRIKNFHWGDMNRALFEALEAGCELPVLVDYDGNISEGPGFNLFMIKDGVVTTPEGTCLDGITRQTALDLLAEQNVKLVIGAFSPDQLRAADEAFITSTAGGIVPVTRIDHRPVGDGEPGPVTTRLKNLYWERHDEGWDGTPIDYAAA